MRIFLPAMAALLLAVAPIAAVQAQTTPSPAQAVPAPTTLPDTPGPKPRVNRLDKRFTAANTTHDGHLTLDQAKAAKWRQVVRNFTTIDADKKGYVTEDNIRTAAQQTRAAKATKTTIKS